MLVYATPLDLARYVTGNPAATEDQAPAEALTLLQSASVLIRRATSRAVYSVDVDLMPINTRIREAFRDATCAMAKAYAVLSVDPSVGAAGVAPGIASKSLGAAAVAYKSTAAQDAAKVAIANGNILTSEAYAILRDAGLLNAAVHSYGFPTAAWAPGPWPVS